MAQTFEEGLKQLEEIRQKLESDTLPLEDMVSLYKEGLTLSRTLGEQLDTVEKQIISLEGDLVTDAE